MSITKPAAKLLAQLAVSDNLHASIERDTEGNPVVVIIAPLTLDPDTEE
ncbi:hypothetical protein GKE82_11295 [Conexibacter sp. W3-3-2]|nr:hypothetical protein [Conexibacter sp. W3-3-2]MTD44859.1 hypothetical protein [Conexibacter sp. W3-3-2]